ASGGGRPSRALDCLPPHRQRRRKHRNLVSCSPGLPRRGQSVARCAMRVLVGLHRYVQWRDGPIEWMARSLPAFARWPGRVRRTRLLAFAGGHPSGPRGRRRDRAGGVYPSSCDWRALRRQRPYHSRTQRPRPRTGRALIRQGEIARGVALLDEAMIAVSTGEASPVVAGGVYCSLLESCRETFDTRRAQEWTAALDSWCVSQPDLVPFRGACLLHRAQILQLRGSCPDALDQAQQACERFLHPTPRAAAGAAFYRVAEIHRLRGEFAEA